MSKSLCRKIKDLIQLEEQALVANTEIPDGLKNISLNNASEREKQFWVLGRKEGLIDALKTIQRKSLGVTEK